jgi:hypothetical protein
MSLTATDILAQEDGGGWTSLLYLLIVFIFPALDALAKWIREKFAKNGEPGRDEAAVAQGTPPKPPLHRAKPPSPAAPEVRGPQPSTRDRGRTIERRPAAKPTATIADRLEQLFEAAREKAGAEPPVPPARPARPDHAKTGRIDPTRRPPPPPKTPSPKRKIEPKPGERVTIAQPARVGRPAERPREPKVVAVATLARPLIEPPQPPHGRKLPRGRSVIAAGITPADLRSVVILSEILNPPLALRDRHDLPG